MLRTAICWLTSAVANNAASNGSVVLTCLSMASKAPLECRVELLRGAAALTNPSLIQAAWAGSATSSQKDEEAAYLKAECRILQACSGIPTTLRP